MLTAFAQQLQPTEATPASSMPGSPSAARICGTPGVSASRACDRRWHGNPRLARASADGGGLGRRPVEDGEVGEGELVFGPIAAVDRAAVEGVERRAAEQLVDLRRDCLRLLALVG